MPGLSWSIDARLCQTGSILREKVPDSPCASCYACKGRALFPQVAMANDRRYAGWVNHPDTWPELIAEQILLTTPIGVPYFRWFSMGDLQSERMFDQICEVADRTPTIQHWLPTQERRYVTHRLDHLPPNLVVRVSGAQIAGATPSVPHASLVAPKDLHSIWPLLTLYSTHTRHYCPASLQQNECGSCRACWDPKVRTVVYLQH